MLSQAWESLPWAPGRKPRPDRCQARRRLTFCGHGGSTVRRLTSGDVRWVRELASMCTLAEVAVVESVRCNKTTSSIPLRQPGLGSWLAASGTVGCSHASLNLHWDPGHFDGSRLPDMGSRSPRSISSAVP